MVLKFKKVLYAPNVHQGGGGALLIPLLRELENNEDILFVLDFRLQLPAEWLPKGEVIYVQPSLISKLLLEWRLKQWVVPSTQILSMANLPPLFVSSNKVSVFIQNWYLVSDVDITDFSLPVYIRIMIERLWLKSRAKKVARFIVQTQSMKRQIRHVLQKNADILPFVELSIFEEEVIAEEKIDYLYVASGEPHKNHKKLISAWKILAIKGRYPGLCLTIDKKSCPGLYQWIIKTKETYGLHIVLVNNLSREKMVNLYKSSKALIYPSLFESFGLPLVEAIECGLPVLAAERNYVHDLIELEDTFDPESPESIANAVDKFTFKPAKLKANLLSAKEFINEVFNR